METWRSAPLKVHLVVLLVEWEWVGVWGREAGVAALVLAERFPETTAPYRLILPLLPGHSWQIKSRNMDSGPQMHFSPKPGTINAVPFKN